MKRKVLIPIGDDDENSTEHSLFGGVHSSLLGWNVDDSHWRATQASLSHRVQMGAFTEMTRLMTDQRTARPDGEITLEDFGRAVKVVDDTYDDVREAKGRVENTDCELTFTSPQQMLEADSQRGYPNAPSFSDPTNLGEANQYPFDFGCPVFVVRQGWGTPFPVFSEFQYLVEANTAFNDDRSGAYSWVGNRIKSLRTMPTDQYGHINAIDVPMVLIPLPDHEPYLVGKVAMLNTNRFSVVGNIADPIRTGVNAGKPLIRPDISFDVFRWLRQNYQPQHPQETAWTDIRIMALEKTLNGFIRSDGERLNDYINNAGYLQSSAMLLKHLSAVNALAEENTETPVVQERVGDFIPSWKDKRKPILIDRAFPQYPVFHDEIRCAGCNGRVLMKLPAGNTLSSLPCPHDSCESTLQFTHLLGNQNGQKGGTENEIAK